MALGKFLLNKFTAKRGHACQIPVVLIDAESGHSLPTAGLTSIILAVQNSDGTWIEKEGSAGISFGVIETFFLYVFPFTIAEVANFKSMPNGNRVFVKLTVGANNMKYEFPAFLTVEEEGYTV